MLQAIADRIIVNLDEIQDNSPILSNIQPIRNSGIVESIGDRVKSVKTGDHILFHQFDELPLPDKNRVIIRERSILGIYSD